MNARVLPDPEALARAATELVLEAEAAAGERFAICLTGGSTPQATHRLLASDEFRGRADWSRWHVFFGDERQVPLDDPRSNYFNARESLLDHVPIPAGQIHPLTDADQYEGLLRAFFGEAPRFDLLMLGMGDDGHTASLFPGSVSLLESERWVIAPPGRGAGHVAADPDVAGAGRGQTHRVPGRRRGQGRRDPADQDGRAAARGNGSGRGVAAG